MSEDVDTKKVIIRVPRCHAEVFADILEMNDLTCIFQPTPQYDEPLDNGPRVLHVFISVEDLQDVDEDEGTHKSFKN